MDEERKEELKWKAEEYIENSNDSEVANLIQYHIRIKNLYKDLRLGSFVYEEMWDYDLPRYKRYKIMQVIVKEKRIILLEVNSEGKSKGRRVLWEGTLPRRTFDSIDEMNAVIQQKQKSF